MCSFEINIYIKFMDFEGHVVDFISDRNAKIFII